MAPQKVNRRKKIDVGAVVKSDEKYLEKIQATEPKQKRPRTSNSFPYPKENRLQLQMIKKPKRNLTNRKMRWKQKKREFIRWLEIFSPPVKESDVIGDWVACTNKPHAKKHDVLYIGKILRRFLVE